MFDQKYSVPEFTTRPPEPQKKSDFEPRVTKRKKEREGKKKKK